MPENTLTEAPASSRESLSAPEIDYRAAMQEVGSNVAVRRLMFVIANVLVPAMLMAASDAMSGSNYPPAIAWLPEHMLTIVGLVTAIGGVLITLVLSRCHMGMVINGVKMAKVRQGELRLAPLNLLGVTSNFVLLTAVSAGSGLCLAAISLGVPWWASCAGGFVLVLALFGKLSFDHKRAGAVCRKLDEAWNHGSVSRDLQEQHAAASLEDTTSDIAVVVTMAAALFAGAFNAMTNVGSIPSELGLEVAITDLQRFAIPALAGFMLVSLLLSCRMVVRLRIALAQHAATLAKLREEFDDPWRFKPLERTFLLYLIVVLLSVASAVILALNEGGSLAGWIAGGGMALASLLWYPIALGVARRRSA